MQKNAGCMECRMAPAHSSPHAGLPAHKWHLVRAPPSRSSSNWSIPERNTSGLGLAPSEPLVPPDEQWPPASLQPSLLRVGSFLLSERRTRRHQPAILCCSGAVRCFSVLLNRQNSVRRGQNPKEKTKIDQALRSGSFEFHFCQKRPGSSRSAKKSIRASHFT